MTTEVKYNSRRFRKRFKEAIKTNREAFEGQYASQIEALSGLSRAEIDEITPGITDLQSYDRLIAVVKAASSTNLSQAGLKEAILNLGGIAVEIAMKIPKLASILV